MRSFLFFTILLLNLFTITHAAMAQDVVADSIISRLRQRSTLRSSFELGQLDVQAYTYGLSHCQKQGLAGRLIPHLLPFQANTAKDAAFEAFSHVHYQWPGEMHLNAIGLESNYPRTARRVMRELYQALFPIYSARRHKDYGSNKSFVLPFYDEGPSRYQFHLAPLSDSLLNAIQSIGLHPDTSLLCCIGFKPLRRHHTMLSGTVLVDTLNAHVLGFDCEGHVDLATFRGQLFFSPDTLNGGLYIPHSSHVDIDYHYLGTRATNSYQTRFRYMTFTPFDSLERRHIPYDLTPYYIDEEIADSVNFHQLRPFDLPPLVDSLLYHDSHQSTPRQHRKRHRIETFSESLVNGSKLGPDNNRLRIYGPLDPASIGYDHFNGVTLEEKARWTHNFSDNSQLYMRADVGYAFRLRELRFRLFNEWTYLPAKRGRLQFEVRRSTANFSSKFIKTVNEALKQKTSRVNFDSLGLDYYQRYEITLQHSIELTNGLMLHNGIMATYRNPVKHGVRKITEQHRDELIDSYYADFAPFVRLEWTPRQYYWYNNGYKTYLPSPSPTFAFELSRAIPGCLGADSNYGRVEFDMQQSFSINRTQTFAYHVGAGKFFNQKGEYFINYRYFSRSQYPTSWEDDRIGGVFHELDEYWYASTPTYIQAHTMYETPFGLLHFFRPISRYIIKERFYWSGLWSEGKSFYDELGYGIDNNYFNLGVFAGFTGLKYYGIGVKFRIEIGRHI